MEVIQRSSFCANEIEIFDAAVRWSDKNGESPILEIISKIRFSLVSKGTHDILTYQQYYVLEVDDLNLSKAR